MQTLLRFLSLIDALSLWSGRLVAWLTFLAVLILTSEVVRRYFFNAPTQWAHEVSTLLFGLLYVLAGAYALKEKAHVGVDIFYSRLPRKGQAWANILGFIFLMLFAGTLVAYGWKFFLASWQNREFSLANQAIPIFPFKLAIPVGAALLLLQGLANTIRDILVLLGKEEEDRAH
ncbi:TRAP transporter small permease subunit [Thermus caldifontis]|uniref:TRAP transporter small permease subunit n=1 Tax=Thermus caldifontis TaxID=1930763 RepID=UPI000DF1BCDB|nr:TRAP transporter small permease subunit [Thermus caldifontis]